MNIYLLFVGGSGIRVARSFIHLCAAGCFEGYHFKMMLIDTDKSNGDTKILKDTIDAYNRVSDNVHEFPSIEYYKEKGSIAVWNPLSANPSDPMKKIIGYDLWDTNDDGKDMQELYNFLYTKAEQEISLEKGFYGHTSIGSYFMTNAITGDAPGALNPEWERFFAGIDGNDLIYVIGSMFGGTGASAIPTIAKILKGADTTANCKSGCAIVMPYYKTVAKDKKVGSINSLFFPAKNKAALYHYADQEIYNDFDHIYFIGEDKERFMALENNNGGEEQRNKANYIEIETALTIGDLVADVNNKKEGFIKTYDVDYNGDKNPNVELINNITKEKNYCSELISFFETAVLFNKAIYYIANENKGAGWVGKYKVEKEHSEAFRIYCKFYTDWLYEILIDTYIDGSYFTPEEALIMKRFPEKGNFDIINIEGADKINLFTDARYVKPSAFSFKDEFVDFDTMKTLTNDDKVNAATGKEILREFDKRTTTDIKSISEVISRLKGILVGGGAN